MNKFEFINGMTQSLAWPILILILIIIVLWCFKDKVEKMAFEVLGAKFKVTLVKESTPENEGRTSVRHESSWYKLYSNGILVQKFKINIASMSKDRQVTYPISFPNELISIQVIGSNRVWISEASLGNCILGIDPIVSEQEIELIISGI